MNHSGQSTPAQPYCFQQQQQQSDVASSSAGGASSHHAATAVTAAAAIAPAPIAAPPVPGAPALPPGWVAIVDPSSGRTYYGNPLTGDTSWEVPSLPPPPPGAAMSLPPPPPAQMQQQQQQQAAPAQHHAPVGSIMPNTNTPAGAGHAGYIAQIPTVPPVAMNYLVPQVRSMMDAEQTTRAALSAASKPPPQLELSDLTAGAVADLINVKREHALAAGEETVPYEPIKPYSLPVLAKPPHIEPGRVEIRANLLYDKLEKL